MKDGESATVFNWNGSRCNRGALVKREGNNLIGPVFMSCPINNPFFNPLIKKGGMTDYREVREMDLFTVAQLG